MRILERLNLIAKNLREALYSPYSMDAFDAERVAAALHIARQSVEDAPASGAQMDRLKVVKAELDEALRSRNHDNRVDCLMAASYLVDRCIEAERVE